MHWPLRSNLPSSCYPAQLRDNPPKTGRMMILHFLLKISLGIYDVPA